MLMCGEKGFDLRDFPAYVPAPALSELWVTVSMSLKLTQRKSIKF